MKVVVNGLDLSNAVLKVIKAVSSKTTNPVLEGIKLSAVGDKLTLTATDMEIAIEKTIICETFIEGQIVVQAKFFAEYVKKLETEENVELSLQKNNQLKISYGINDGLIQTLNAEDFPIIKKDIKEKFVTISQKSLKSIISKTVFCCIADDSRPILKGCLLKIEDDSITSVALDGFRLAYCKEEIISSAGQFEVVVPSKALQEIIRLIENEENDITITFQENHLMLEIDNTILTTRLLEGQFINYKQIITNSFLTEVVVNRKQLLNSVERASIVAKSIKNLVKFDIKDGQLLVSANSEDGNVNETVPVKNKGKDILIAFNSKYLIDAIKAIEEEFVTLQLNSTISPCIMTPTAKEGNFYLILPIRLNA